MSIQRREIKTGVRWDVRLRDPGGRVYTKTFRTKRDAEAYERAELRARDQGAWVDPKAGKQTVAEWIEFWYPKHEPALSPKTRAQYRSAFNRWVIPAIGQRRLVSLTRLDLQELVNRWAEDARPTTVHHRFSVLRVAMSAAVTADVIARSPCHGVKLPRKQRKRRQLLTVDQLDALAEVMEPNYRAMVWLGAMLGLRWGEVAGLRVQAIDLLRRKLSVEETVGEAAGVVHFGPPKSGAGRRQLPLSEPMVEIIAEHLRLTGLTAADGEALLFRAPRGGPLRYGHWHHRIWMPAREAIGRPDLGFHDLRRLYATLLVEARVDVKVSQELMGHEDIRLTRGLYAQAVDETKRQANDAIVDQLLQNRSASGSLTSDRERRS